MIHPVSHATPAHEAAPQPAPARKSSPPAKAQTLPTDTVQISQAALSARALVQEASETQAQTTREATAGDVQARNLLAKEAARKG